ncbi:MAG: vraS, partial [Nocardioides sp.]|nr:vraS [Nocardioides sp.]
MAGRRTQRITVGARLFTLVALSGPILWGRDETELVALAGVAGVWVLATLAEQRRDLARNVPVVEAALTGLVCGLTLGNSPAILLALAVPPFTAAVVR